MTRAPRASRHRSREAALQVLYAIDMARRRPDGPPPDPAETFERTAQNFELPEGARAFAKELVAGVTAHGAELDAVLTAHAENWRLPRMAAVDRNILRLAVYELHHTDTPPPVVIDEAVELARRFGGERSPGFVNGLLDAVAKALRASGA